MLINLNCRKPKFKKGISVIQFLIVTFAILIFSLPAYSAPLTKVYGPNCFTETTQIIQNGIMVSEISKTECKEYVNRGYQKFDPENVPSDALLNEAAKLGIYTIFIKLLKI